MTLSEEERKRYNEGIIHINTNRLGLDQESRSYLEDLIEQDLKVVKVFQRIKGLKPRREAPELSVSDMKARVEGRYARQSRALEKKLESSRNKSRKRQKSAKNRGNK